MYEIVECTPVNKALQPQYTTAKDGKLVVLSRHMLPTYGNLMILIDSIEGLLKEGKKLSERTISLREGVGVKTLCTFNNLDDFSNIRDKYPELFI